MEALLWLVCIEIARILLNRYTKAVNISLSIVRSLVRSKICKNCTLGKSACIAEYFHSKPMTKLNKSPEHDYGLANSTIYVKTNLVFCYDVSLMTNSITIPKNLLIKKATRISILKSSQCNRQRFQWRSFHASICVVTKSWNL